MRVEPKLPLRAQGITLIETLMFIVVVSIALTSLISVFNQNVTNSVDPVIRMQAMEKAQALMEEILARKFDENTPTGGVPACGTSAGAACAGIAGDTDYDDVGDYHGFTQSSGPFSLEVSVVSAGGDLGLASADARRVSVSVQGPDGKTLVLSAYKVNF